MKITDELKKVEETPDFNDPEVLAEVMADTPRYLKHRKEIFKQLGGAGMAGLMKMAEARKREREAARAAAPAPAPGAPGSVEELKLRLANGKVSVAEYKKRRHELGLK